MEAYPQLQQALQRDGAKAAAVHAIERAALHYQVPLSDEEAAERMRLHLAPPLLSKLFRFQQEGVQFALRHEGRCLIADEMGLGKTV